LAEGPEAGPCPRFHFKGTRLRLGVVANRPGTNPALDRGRVPWWTRPFFPRTLPFPRSHGSAQLQAEVQGVRARFYHFVTERELYEICSERVGDLEDILALRLRLFDEQGTWC